MPPRAGKRKSKKGKPPILPTKMVPESEVLAEAYRMFKRKPQIQAAVAEVCTRLHKRTRPPASLPRQTMAAPALGRGLN